MPKLDLFSDYSAEKKVLSEQLKSCSEAFDIEARRICRNQSIASLIDYLADVKKETMADVSTTVEKVVNSLIERYNIGSKEFILDARAMVVKKFKPTNAYTKLLSSITGELSAVNTKYTTADIRASMEGFTTPPTLGTGTKGLALGELYFDKYISSYLKVFPEDYVKHITK
jgi:hypothetical protein